MSAFFEGRRSDSPYIDMLWRGHVEGIYAPVCPADVRWNLLFVKRGNFVRVTVEGPTTQFVPKYQTEDYEFLVIKFQLGTFFHFLTPDSLVNGDRALPEATNQSFWLHSSTWELPTFENAEVFVERLARAGLLVHEPVIDDALKDQPQPLSDRSVRRRFLQATGLTQGAIRQIERAQYAAALLGQKTPILDVVAQAGYADQPHLTRSLRRYYGQTPAQILYQNPSG
jgi:hypothetical protein